MNYVLCDFDKHFIFILFGGGEILYTVFTPFGKGRPFLDVLNTE